ncbi:hypothetical protein NEUTE2DRAFT_74529 [Neurospora tetrasperma FGSC 2509]|nr:hypothetical protein NEUTE2DRAFT_74529 [Neurospora tetrasperma FGSC 2509]
MLPSIHCNPRARQFYLPTDALDSSQRTLRCIFSRGVGLNEYQQCLGRSNGVNVDFQSVTERAFALLVLLREEQVRIRATLQALRAILRGLLALPDDLRPLNWVTEMERVLEEAKRNRGALRNHRQNYTRGDSPHRIYGTIDMKLPTAATF